MVEQGAENLGKGRNTARAHEGEEAVESYVLPHHEETLHIEEKQYLGP